MHPLLPQQHFTALSKVVYETLNTLNWRQKYGTGIFLFVIRLIIFSGGIWLFHLPGILFKIIGMLLVSYTYYGIGLTGTHETSHRAFVASRRLNVWLGYFFSDFWSAQSSLWWHYRHVQIHHTFTNIPSKDPQIFYYRWINKYLFFFVVPYLILFWLIAHSIKFLWPNKKQLALYIGLAIMGVLFHTWIFSLVTPTLPLAVLSMFIMRSVFAPVFLHLAIFNHAALDQPEVKPPWLPHQTITTRNLKRYWFITYMGGSAFVDCHIEHHLFPSFSNQMLEKIQPIVTRYAADAGYIYREIGYWECMKYILAKYRTLFKEPLEKIV